MSELKSVKDVLALRQAIMVLFETDDATDDAKNMRKLYRVEKQITELEFPNQADRDAAIKIFFEDGDKAIFADDFKTKLFARLQSFV